MRGQGPESAKAVRHREGGPNGLKGKVAMTFRLKSLALIGLCLSVTLVGCGRKGGLDDPTAPSPQAESAVDPATAVAVDTAPPRNEKSFPLDFLIQ